MLKLSTASIFRAIKPGTLVLAALLGTSLCAQAGPDVTSSKDAKDKNVIQQPPPAEPKFWFDLSAGGEFDIHSTKFLNDAGATFVSPAGVAIPGRIQSRDFTSTHDLATINGRAEAGYKVLPNVSVFVGGTYSHSDGQSDRRVGRVYDTTGVYSGVPAEYNLYGSFGQYQSYSGIAGVKVGLPRTILDFIHAPKAISPYFSLSGGGKYLDAQQADFFAKNTALVSTGKETLYQSGWVGTVEGEFGYDLKLTRNFDVTLESGYGYDTKPEHEALSEINNANRDGDRFYSTVYLGAKLKF